LKNALAYVQQRCCQQKFASQIIARLGQKIEEGKGNNVVACHRMKNNVKIIYKFTLH
jgi:hypothetical protein